ncbi:FCP1 y domain-containing protein [Spatholobus suberectus]|nr:FCP1 y domain-containing protein [Spatholobus suberectus]
MDVVNDLHMGPPATTNLGGSLTSTEDVNAPQKQKMVSKKRPGDAVEHEGPDDRAVYDFSDKTVCVKTYARRKMVNSNCRRNSGYSSPENCKSEPTIQDHHEDDSHKFSDGPLRVDLMDGETKFSIDQVTSQSGAAAEEIKSSTDNINEQRFMTASSAVDIPVEQLETNGRQLDYTEITRNDQCCAGDVSDLSLDTVRDGHLEISQFSLERSVAGNSKNKLLILDVNGLLADFVSVSHPRRRYRPEPEPNFCLKGRKVYKRPFCDDFLQFCFDRFHVGVWSSRAKRNVDEAIKFLMGKSASKLLFCWNQSHCTRTEFTTVENRDKPLVLKELRKLWEKEEPGLPWEKGEFNESNTLLLDDSPYKALVNPVSKLPCFVFLICNKLYFLVLLSFFLLFCHFTHAISFQIHTAIFPYSYRYYHTKDNELGPGGDLRVYLERLAMAENVQKYVSDHSFGQRHITETNPSWRYYCKVIDSVKRSRNARPSRPRRELTAYRTMHDNSC